LSTVSDLGQPPAYQAVTIAQVPVLLGRDAAHIEAPPIGPTNTMPSCSPKDDQFIDPTQVAMQDHGRELDQRILEHVAAPAMSLVSQPIGIFGKDRDHPAVRVSHRQDLARNSAPRMPMV
jgi:hypothetical protein